MPERRTLFKVLRPLFGLLLLAALIAFVDFDQVGKVLARVDGAWIVAAAALVVAGALVGAVGLHLLLNAEGTLPFAAFLPVFWTSWAVGLVLPGQIGDMASMATLLRRHQLSAAITVGRSMADKLVSLVLMVLFAAYGLSGGRWSLVLLAAIAIAVFAWLLPCLRTLTPRIGFLRTSRIALFAAAALSETAGFARSHRHLIAINTVLTVLKICITGTVYWCMFKAVGAAAPDAWDVIPQVAVTSLVAYIPISFNGLGTAEAAGIAVFGSIGVDAAKVLASYLLLRALGMAIAWIPAAAWLLLGRRRREDLA